jgi:hypothetical protein
MDEELESLKANKTWRVVKRPGGGRKLIRCKWVYKIKENSDGSVERYKARLVAKGFQQKEGVDYLETYAPVARMETIRLMLAVAAHYDLNISQLDFKTAFLYGELQDVEIYMQLPRGYTIKQMMTEEESIQNDDDEDEGENDKCLLLSKGLYGLKQAGREWNTKLNTTLISFGFKRAKSDLCLYFYKDKGRVMILTVWVDDILAAHNSDDTWRRLVDYLRRSFKVKDMGECAWILGMGITRDRQQHKLHINQELHIRNILKRFNMSNCKSAKVPMKNKPKLRQQQEGEQLTDKPYRSLVGALMYLAVCTRPDISYAVGQLARYGSAPTETHWRAAMDLLRYLKGTEKDGLLYDCKGASKGASPVLRMYSDSDWAACEDTRRSCTGYVSEFANATITWCSRMQGSVKDSTLYAEYTAVSEALKDVLWLRSLLTEIDLDQRGPTTMLQDNQGTIAFSKNPRVHKRTKHIDVKHHMVREHIEEGVIIVQYVESRFNKADLMTKALAKSLFTFHKEGINVKPNEEI